MSISRRDKLLGGLDLPNMLGVEIGALANPFVRREDGEILYVDYADRETLASKYENDSYVNVENIVHVDAIWGGNTLDDAVKGRKVDYVIASHVIEHVPDMITWLKEIRSILRETGEVRLIIPDRRFTFDYLRQETGLAQLLNSYLVRARIPQPLSVLDHALNITDVDHTAAWEGKIRAEDLKRRHTSNGAISLARDVIANQTYHDVHCWVFTPRSFARLMRDVSDAGLLDFACAKFYDSEPGTIDFFVSLRPESSADVIAESWKRVEQGAQEFRQPVSPLKELAELEQKLLKAKQENDNLKLLKNDVAIANAEKEQIRDEIRTLREDFSSKIGEVEEIRKSMSWRITAPMRAVSTALRHLVGRR